MIRFLPIFLLLACETKTEIVYRDCDIVTVYDACNSACVDLGDGDTPLTVWQFGGSDQPTDGDDGEPAIARLFTETDGSRMICGYCTDIEGEEGKGPWSYLAFDIYSCEAGDTGEMSAYLIPTEDDGADAAEEDADEGGGSGPRAGQKFNLVERGHR